MSAATHLVAIFGSLLFCGALALDTWQLTPVRIDGKGDVIKLSTTSEKRNQEAEMSAADGELKEDLMEFIYTDGIKENPNKDGFKNLYSIIQGKKEVSSPSSKHIDILTNINLVSALLKHQLSKEEEGNSKTSMDDLKEYQNSERAIESKRYDWIPQIESGKTTLTDLEENTPGSHKWPKYLPHNLWPISPFPEAEYAINRRPIPYSSKQTKRDEIFMPEEKVMPPPFAGPGLYPLSMFDREFRVPFV